MTDEMPSEFVRRGSGTAPNQGASRSAPTVIIARGKVFQPLLDECNWVLIKGPSRLQAHFDPVFHFGFTVFRDFHVKPYGESVDFCIGVAVVDHLPIPE